ncbi:MAG: amidase [Planctomycetes bacterium]|nr:amidase [Planctomycetota bacterium]MCB9884945.1 amidase [Planctomycetota bacterium]
MRQSLPGRSRRDFLLGLGATPLVAGAALPATPRDTAADLEAGLRLLDLQFTAEERQQAVARVESQRGTYASLRKQPIGFELPPCAHFDPWPAGVARPAPDGVHAVAIPTDAPAPTGNADLAFATILELASWLRRGLVTSRRLTELALARLLQFDKALLCVVTLLRDEALARADAMDEELAAGTDRGPLHGIPFGAKDLFAWPGAPTTFGAAPFKNQVWNLTATPLQRLHDAGAVLVAKLSLGALAMGDLWHGGRTRNPWNPEQGSSGSSAGSAAAVAAGLLPFALGTETLGSIVSPCRQCGVAGLRPTFGAVSRHGAMPLSWTMDKVGVIARSARCAGLVFDRMRGADGHDPAARDTQFRFQPGRGLDGLRLGILQDRGFPRRDEDRAFVAWLEQQGATPKPVTLPDGDWQAMLLMLHAEAAAAFDQFLRDGLAPQLPGQADGDWPNSFRAARVIGAVEYLQAARLRSALQRAMHEVMQDVDVLVAATHGGSSLVATNLTGHPTYVLPVGASERDRGRPTMLGLIGRLDGEGELLAVAEAWQDTTRWHLARPELSR